MKKTVLTFIGIIVALYLAVSLINYKSEYNAEVRLFKANKLFAQILRNPESIPAHLYDKTVNSYKGIIKKFPNSASAKRAVLFLGQVHIINNKFDAARADLNLAKSQYKDDLVFLADIQFLIGGSYERQDRWDRARSIYEGILKDYPDTPIAMQIPIYIARYLQEKSSPEETGLAYQQAISYYQKRAKAKPSSYEGYIALTNLVTCFVEQKMWPEAVDTLATLTEQYPRSRELLKMFEMINLICLEQLKSPQKAIEIYDSFIIKYPKHPLVRTLNTQIERLKKGKQ